MGYTSWIVWRRNGKCRVAVRFGDDRVRYFTASTEAAALKKAEDFAERKW